MKKAFWITLAFAILLVALAIWGYLFLFGTPDSTNDIFTDLGFDIVSNPTIPTEATESQPSETLVDVAGTPLKQLTLRPVAGFTSFSKDGIDYVRYMERGTGHIYDINLSTGQEDRVSNTTNNRVVDAVFGSTGEYVAFISENGYIRTVTAGRIVNTDNDGNLSGSPLPINSDNLSFSGTSTLNFTLTSDGTYGYRYDLQTNQQSEIFFVPFLSINTIKTNSDNLIYNRYAPELQGNVYRVSGNSYTGLLSQQFGLAAEASDDWLVYSFNKDNETNNVAVNRLTNTTYNLPIRIIPEKCVIPNGTSNFLYCSAALANTKFDYLKDWYQGKLRANDALWRVNITQESATLLNNPPTTVGREVDMTDMQINGANTMLLFTNKNDNTLWQYDLLVN